MADEERVLDQSDRDWDAMCDLVKLGDPGWPALRDYIKKIGDDRFQAANGFEVFEEMGFPYEGQEALGGLLASDVIQFALRAAMSPELDYTTIHEHMHDHDEYDTMAFLMQLAVNPNTLPADAKAMIGRVEALGGPGEYDSDGWWPMAGTQWMDVEEEQWAWARKDCGLPYDHTVIDESDGE